MPFPRAPTSAVHQRNNGLDVMMLCQGNQCLREIAAQFYGGWKIIARLIFGDPLLWPARGSYWIHNVIPTFTEVLQRFSSCELLRPIPVGLISQTAPCVTRSKDGLQINRQPFKSSVRRGKRFKCDGAQNSIPLSVFGTTERTAPATTTTTIPSIKPLATMMVNNVCTDGQKIGSDRLRSCRWWWWWCCRVGPPLS